MRQAVLFMRTISIQGDFSLAIFCPQELKGTLIPAVALAGDLRHAGC